MRYPTVGGLSVSGGPAVCPWRPVSPVSYLSVTLIVGEGWSADACRYSPVDLSGRLAPPVPVTRGGLAVSQRSPLHPARAPR